MFSSPRTVGIEGETTPTNDSGSRRRSLGPDDNGHVNHLLLAAISIAFCALAGGASVLVWCRTLLMLLTPPINGLAHKIVGWVLARSGFLPHSFSGTRHKTSCCWIRTIHACAERAHRIVMSERRMSALYFSRVSVFPQFYSTSMAVPPYICPLETHYNRAMWLLMAARHTTISSRSLSPSRTLLAALFRADLTSQVSVCSVATLCCFSSLVAANELLNTEMSHNDITSSAGSQNVFS